MIDKDFLIRKNNGKNLFNEFYDFIKSKLQITQDNITIVEFENYWEWIQLFETLPHTLNLSLFNQTQKEILQSIHFVNRLIKLKTPIYLGVMKYEDSGVLNLNNVVEVDYLKLIDEIKKLNDDGFFICSNQSYPFKLDVYFNDTDSFDLHIKTYVGCTIKTYFE